MRKILRLTLIFVFTLVTANNLWHNLTFNRNLQTLLLVALILAIFEVILKPIIKILLLPLNIITLGTIRVVIDLFGLYLASFLLSDFIVNNISISSFDWQGFTIPNLTFNGIFAYLVTSITISIIHHIFTFILKKKDK